MKKIALSLLLFVWAWYVQAQGGQLDVGFGINGTYQFDIGFTHTRGYDLVIQPDGKMISLGILENQDEEIILTRFQPDGSLDLSFGNQGKVIYTNNSVMELFGIAMALQPDGKILVTGYLRLSSSNVDIMLLRFNSDGTPDNSFGGTGLVISNLGSPIETAYAVDIQEDGKILIAGRTGNPNGRMFVQRYLENGIKDPSFNGNGTVMIDIDVEELDALLDLLVEPDGKILAAGVSNGANIALIRLLPNGKGDPDFGNNGVVQHNITGHLTQVNAIALKADGKIFAAASIYDTTSTTYTDLCVAAFLPSGQFDSSFNATGWIQFDVEPALFSAAVDILLDQDDNIVIGGVSEGRFCVAKLAPTGVFDPVFGENGIQITQFNEFTPDLLYSGAQAIRQQADGKLLVLGTSKRTQTLIRYLENGLPDPEFGNMGVTQTTFYNPGSTDRAYAAAFQPDGKLILAGGTYRDNLDGNSEFALVRFQENGLPDVSFGNNGRVVTSWGNKGDQARAVAVQPDGMILAAGYTATGQYYYTSFALARFFPDGQLDEQFGTFGLVNNYFGQTTEDVRANAMVLQPDGKIVLAGRAGGKISLARFLPDGTPDPEFGLGGNVQIADIPGGSEAFALAIQPDGKLLAAGSNGDIILVRLTPNGSLDPTFGIEGKVFQNLGHQESANAIAIQPDGKIVVAGNIYNTIEVFIGRFLPDGSPDTGFNGTGMLVTGFGFDSHANALGIQTDGKILVGGSGNYDFAVARFLPDGISDPSFGVNGLAYTGFGNGGSDFNTARALLIEPDHDIILAGSSGVNWQPQNQFAIARFKAGAVNSIAQPTAFIQDAALYPNLAVDASVLVFNLPEAAEVSVDVYLANGQLISSPVQGMFFQEGAHRINLTTTAWLPGRYFVRIYSNQGSITLPLVKVW